jgi:hypothetical protein
MATEAVAGQDGLHILIEIELLCGIDCLGPAAHGRRQQGSQDEQRCDGS